MPLVLTEAYCTQYPKTCAAIRAVLSGTGVAPTPQQMPVLDVLRQEILDVFQALEDELGQNPETPDVTIVLKAAKVFQRLQMQAEVIALTHIIPNVMEATEAEMELPQIELLAEASQIRADALQIVGRVDAGTEAALTARNLQRIATRMRALTGVN